MNILTGLTFLFLGSFFGITSYLFFYKKKHNCRDTASFHRVGNTRRFKCNYCGKEYENPIIEGTNGFRTNPILEIWINQHLQENIDNVKDL